jgi:simple sugar transport system substrate-binding protein
MLPIFNRRRMALSRRDLLRLGGAAGLIAAAGRIQADEPLKVGVALVSPPAEVGWERQHSDGIKAIKQAMGDRVSLSVVDTVLQPQDAERVFRGFAATGHRLVIGTSFSHGAPITRVARQFPAVAFDDCSGMTVTDNLGAFEARYYEGTYVAGIAAGRVTKTGKLGFIGGFPIPDIVGPANAFLLGAQSVRPDATCGIIFVNSWADLGKEKDAARALIAQGCDVLCAHTDSPAVAQFAEQSGVWVIGYASDLRGFAPTRQITSVMLDWSSVYVAEAEAVAAGTWRPQSRWQGLKEGVVRLAPVNDLMPAEVRTLLAKSAESVANHTLLPYLGEIRDQAGKVRVAKGNVLPDGDVRGMDWLVAGMQGHLRG